ncbi:MAG: hypothetical protein HRT38_16710 [Alteromonadaceae bacterium]|nr:hypothetical protein [Alteromonadaceae bacterium]
MKKAKSKFKVLSYSLLCGIGILLFVLLVDHLNSGRTYKTTKWDLSIKGETQYTCLTYSEMTKKMAELDKRTPSVSYEHNASGGIGSWLCEQGWKDKKL